MSPDLEKEFENNMASFAIPCECGKSLRVSASQAGTNKDCICGRSVPVPSFRDLQEKFQVQEIIHAHKTSPLGMILGLGIVAFLLGLVWLLNLPSLAFLLFILMFLGGKLWFLAVMFNEMGANAILVFLIPFFDWIFLFIRFDVAWKPVLFQAIGFVFLIVGIGLLPSL